MLTGGFALGAIFLPLTTRRLDADKEYAAKVQEIKAVNMSVARDRLAFIAEDLTQAGSRFALDTLDRQQFIYERTVEIYKCFKRSRWCSRANRIALIGCEFTKWSALILIVTVVGIFASLEGWLPSFVIPWLIRVAYAALGMLLLSFAVSEFNYQTIRANYRTLENLDAVLPS
jgi:hypothetical protein